MNKKSIFKGIVVSVLGGIVGYEVGKRNKKKSVNKAYVAGYVNGVGGSVRIHSNASQQEKNEYFRAVGCPEETHAKIEKHQRASMRAVQEYRKELDSKEEKKEEKK